MTILPQIINRVNAIPIKLSIIFFTELKQNMSQSVWKHKRPWIAKAILKKNRAGGISLLDFRQSYSHEDSMLLAQNQKYKPAEQDKNQEINLYTYGHLDFDKGSKNIQWRKGSPFNK